MDMDTSPSNLNPEDLTVREQFRRYGYTFQFFFFLFNISLGPVWLYYIYIYVHILSRIDEGKSF